ncbi:MAG: gamma-carboxygeranoyl-CoA hydratase [Zetaproteobacteria bacterium]|nr:MAG: gamma-carboxygeranoyl-CoA hydratase [Zetaproteobacteria bacterium]
MSDDIVVLEIEDGVATVTLNRRDVHNAFDEAMIARLSAIFDELAGRNDVLAVVLCGAGKSFSAGADMNWMKRAADSTEEQNKADALLLAGMLNKLNNLPKVTIACVRGVALGGGMGLVSCCDIVIADDSAKFGLSEVKLGLIPATIGPYVLAAIGPRHMRRYAQTGERFGVEEAHRIGLVHIVADRPEGMPYKLHMIIKEVQANGPKAMAASKTLCLDLMGREINQDLIDETADRISVTRAGDEAKEGLSAFLEKRKPEYTNKR